MPKGKNNTDVSVLLWFNKKALREAKKEAKRRKISRKQLLEVAAVEGLEKLKKEILK